MYVCMYVCMYDVVVVPAAAAVIVLLFGGSSRRRRTGVGGTGSGSVVLFERCVRVFVCSCVRVFGK